MDIIQAVVDALEEARIDAEIAKQKRGTPCKNPRCSHGLDHKLGRRPITCPRCKGYGYEESV